MTPKYDTSRLNGINILNVASDLGIQLKRRGLTYVARCPFHADKTPSLTFYHSDRENRAHCFGCGKDLSVIDLVMETQQCDFKQACDYLGNRYGITPIEGSNSKAQVNVMPVVVSPVVPMVNEPRYFIDDRYLKQSFSRASSFVRWLETMINDKERLTQVLFDYYIGATRDGGVIYWQIDRQGRIRSGKVIHFHPNGHRVKNNDDYRHLLGLAPNAPLPSSANDWIHSILMRVHLLPPDWQLEQCLFGEHLLGVYPTMPVAVVEAEKTAVFMACLRPDLLWLATGGCTGLKEERLMALKGRRVTFFPDSGKYEEWRNALHSMAIAKEIKYNIDDQLEPYEPNTDIVDVFLGEAKLKEPPAAQPSTESAPVELTPSEKAWQQMKARNPTLELLEKGLDLVPVSVRKI